MATIQRKVEKRREEKEYLPADRIKPKQTSCRGKASSCRGTTEKLSLVEKSSGVNERPGGWLKIETSLIM